MREIAVRAVVDSAPSFFTPRTSATRFFLTINEPLEQITTEAEAVVGAKAQLVGNLLAVAQFHYRFFGQRAALARLALREMTFYETGAQAASFHKTRERLFRLFGRAIDGQRRQLAKSQQGRKLPAFFDGARLGIGSLLDFATV